uniref:Uncharacterized protein n=1 Tax=Bionectria ochroleuca TaxID=29856 RepID=A0A8H7N215_BIOOC
MPTSFSVLLDDLHLIFAVDYSQTVTQRYYAIQRAVFQDLGENRPEERRLTLSVDDTSIEFHANTHLETSPAYICRCQTRTPGTISYDLRLDSSFLAVT